MFEETDDRSEGQHQSESVNANAPFVGRKEVKVRIKKDIKSKDLRLFQITGGAVVGKSRLAEVIVRDAPEVITTLVPELAESFYRRCKSAAELFGTEFDVACIDSCLGASVGYVKGNGLKKALDILLEAEKKIPADCGFQRVKLMSHIEWNLYRQGKINEALRYQNLCLAVEPSGVDKRRIKSVQIKVQNHKALALLLLGRKTEALNLLEDTMEFANKTFENHPAVRVMLNSLGLVHCEQNEPDIALKYFQASLTERRKFAGRDKRNLVVVLINVGNLLMSRNKHTLGLQLLDEAVEIRRNIEWIHLDTAVAVENRGKILRKCERYEEALESSREALRIYQECVDSHFVLATVRLDIAKCLELLGQFDDAKQILNEVLSLRFQNEFEQNKQLYECILQSFDQLMNLVANINSEWKRIAEEKCMYYQSLLQDESFQTDRVQYKEELQRLMEEIQNKIAIESVDFKENRNSSASFKVESVAAVDKLLKAEGQPYNLKCNDGHLKFPEKEIRISILSGNNRKERMAEGDDSTIDGILGNNKIANVDVPVCCDRTLSNEISGCDPGVGPSSECNYDSSSPIFCSSHGQLPNDLSVKDSDVETASVFNYKLPSPVCCSNEKLNQSAKNQQMEEKKLCTDVEGLSLRESNSMKECLSKDLKENQCSYVHDTNPNECSGSLKLDRLHCYDTVRVDGCSFSKVTSIFSYNSEETDCNWDRDYDRNAEIKSEKTSENKCNGNMHQIEHDLACLHMDSLKFDYSQFCDRVHSDSSTITGSSMSSTETILNHSLDKKPDKNM